MKTQNNKYCKVGKVYFAVYGQSQETINFCNSVTAKDCKQLTGGLIKLKARQEQEILIEQN